jgi:hypothetical protein
MKSGAQDQPRLAAIADIASYPAFKYPLRMYPLQPGGQLVDNIFVFQPAAILFQNRVQFGH